MTAPAVTVLGTPVFNTTSGTKTVTATPAVGDQIFLIVAHSGNTAATAPTDNNSDGLGSTYSLIATALKATSADTMKAWVRNAPIGSASSTVFTSAPGTSSGGGLAVMKVTGMTHTGSAAVMQSAIQSNQGAGTPAPVLSVVNTFNPVIGAIFNATNPAGMTARTGFTEGFDNGYATPATGLEVISRDSGETGTTQTWGSASASAFCSLIFEVDGRNTLQSTQSVPQASLTATASAPATLTSTQSVPDAQTTAIVQTQALTSSDRRRQWLRFDSNHKFRAYRSRADAVQSRSLTVAQNVPDASLTATAKAVDSLSSTQSVPDAALFATIGGFPHLSANQIVPDAALTATAATVVKASSTQTVPDAVLSALVLNGVHGRQRRFFVVYGNKRRIEWTSSAGNTRSLSATQLVPDASLVATAGTVMRLSSIQSVPDAALTATAVVIAKLSSTQQVPDAGLNAEITTNLNFIKGAYQVYYAGGGVGIIAWRGPEFVPPAASITANQTVPDAVLVATAATIMRLSSTQSVPDASLVASAAVRVKASSAQIVPDAALTATAATVVKASSTQTVPDASLVATAVALDKITATQLVPDAALLAFMATTGVDTVHIFVDQLVEDAFTFSRVSTANGLHSTQQVPDAVLVATAATIPGLRATQVVPDATLVARVGAVASLQVTQLEHDADLFARVFSSSRLLSADQQVPDAVLTAFIATKQWGKPAVMTFSIQPVITVTFNHEPA